MASDDTPAGDLVVTAARALHANHDRNRKVAEFHADAVDVVVAVLRRVVSTLRSDGATGASGWRDAYGQASNDLEMLADEIEGGATDATP